MTEKVVRRYDPEGYDVLSALMRETEYGDWVRGEDYDALQSRLDAAERNICELSQTIRNLNDERDDLGGLVGNLRQQLAEMQEKLNGK